MIFWLRDSIIVGVFVSIIRLTIFLFCLFSLLVILQCFINYTIYKKCVLLFSFFDCRLFCFLVQEGENKWAKRFCILKDRQLFFFAEKPQNEFVDPLARVFLELCGKIVMVQVWVESIVHFFRFAQNLSFPFFSFFFLIGRRRQSSCEDFWEDWIKDSNVFSRLQAARSARSVERFDFFLCIIGFF